VHAPTTAAQLASLTCLLLAPTRADVLPLLLLLAPLVLLPPR
jgi:hypothetical protein